MSDSQLLRGLVVLALSGVFACGVRRDDRRERQPAQDLGRLRRYSPAVNGWLLPMFLTVLIIASLLTLPLPVSGPNLFNLGFSMLLHLSAYSLLLLLALPLLRRRISARACAMLWLLPNYLYLLQYDWMIPDRPLWVIPLSMVWLRRLGILWAAGFCAVLGWKILSHLLYRRQILRPARAVTEPEVLDLWAEAQRNANFKRTDLTLVRSPAVQTPLSIGFFGRTLRVVLPERPYTQDELRLIFCHEIVHIGREDAVTKFFMVFCCALCWFNPLVWLSMSRSADDLELSCDETVLLEADDATRRQYAHLLLTTAGAQRGFTTCLSVSARALRYRLRCAAKPGKRFSGAVTVGLVFFLFAMSYGFVAVGEPPTTGAAALFGGQSPTDYGVSLIVRSDAGYEYYHCADEAALTAYLAEQPLQRVLGGYRYDDTEHRYTLICTTPASLTTFHLSDGVIELVPPYQDVQVETKTYRCLEPMDWAYFESLLTPKQ